MSSNFFMVCVYNVDKKLAEDLGTNPRKITDTKFNIFFFNIFNLFLRRVHPELSLAGVLTSHILNKEG